MSHCQVRQCANVTPMLGSADKNSGTLGSVPERAAHPVPEVAELLGGVGERYVWKLIASGELTSFKSGRLRMVARKDIEAYIDRLREDELKLRAAVAANIDGERPGRAA